MSQKATPILTTHSHLDISSNEMMINAVLNRNFKKLFDNDNALLGVSRSISQGVYRILPYEKGKSYSKNDLVWFVDFYLSPKNEKEYNEEYSKLDSEFSTTEEYDELKKKYFTVSLYLLRSLSNNNTNFPKREIVDMIPVFDASGWKNEYPSGSIYTDYFQEFTVFNLKQKLHELHEVSKTYHKFGELSSFLELDKAVLKTDMSNLDPDRSHVFFPNETVELDSNDTIVEGSVRKWDCGLLEYEMIFKLGDSRSIFASYNPDGSIKTSEDLDANYLNLNVENYGASIYSEFSNRKYYLNDSDSDIFNLSGGFDVTVNGLVQHNVNQYLNSYYGTIKFPIPFIDRNYAIFHPEIPSSIRSNGNIMETNVNCMVFVNKSMDSVTAMLIVPNYVSGDVKVLGENRFRCQIIGRWR